MVDGLAAAAVEFRGLAPGPGHRRLLGHEADRAGGEGEGRRRAITLAGDPCAQEQRGRRGHGLLHHLRRLRADLAHLVAGDRGRDRRDHHRTHPGLARGKRGRDPGRADRRLRTFSPAGRNRMSLGTLATPYEDDVPISERGPASIDVTAGFGFWLFLLSDIVL